MALLPKELTAVYIVASIRDNIWMRRAFGGLVTPAIGYFLLDCLLQLLYGLHVPWLDMHPSFLVLH
jgi:hypothetical protein